MSKPLLGLYLGQRPYAQMLQLQQRCALLRKTGGVGDIALFLEHPATITLGRGTKAQHLLASPQRLAALGVELHTINRGGDITLHAPGQLVAYPIVELTMGRRDVRRYVQMLTEVMRQTAAAWGVATGTVQGYIGLWVDQEQPRQWTGEAQAQSLAKLGAIGVAISRWVTSHGFALNLTTDLTLFDLIVPCGIAAHPCSSIRALNGQSPTAHDAARIAHAALAQQMALEALPLIDATSFDLDSLLTLGDASFSARLLGPAS